MLVNLLCDGWNRRYVWISAAMAAVANWEHTPWFAIALRRSRC
jgi:hypothetical protein